MFFCKAYGATRPSKCPLTFAQSFAKLSRNFRANNTIRRPQPSAGGRSEEQQTLGALVFGSRKHFWKLGCCIWSLFLETSESNIRQYLPEVQGCASRPWCLAVATYVKGKVDVLYHSPTGPQAPGPGAGPGARVFAGGLRFPNRRL